MKKVISCMLVLAVLALSSMAYAGERAGAFSVSPFVGGFVFDEDPQQQPHLDKNRPLYGLRLGYDWTDHFATELVGAYISAEMNATGKNLDAWNYRLDLLYNFMPQTKLVPYLAVGGGGQAIRYGALGGTSYDGTFNAGGGFKFFMTDDIALRADARHILDFQHNELDRDIISNWEYSAGLTFLFGGKEAPVAAARPEPIPEPVQPRAEPVPAQPEPTPAPPEPIPAAEPTPGHYKYCITLDIEFDIDQAIIRPQYRDQVAKAGDFMKKYPTTTAVIEGHTDNVGSHDYNMQLSQRRAESVVNYLVDNFGIDRSRLSAKGYGFTRPVADNATEEGKQKNRRIDAIIDCAFDVQKLDPAERLCMSLVVDFDSGKSEIKPQYRDEIAKVAGYMKQYPTTTAVIEGHTDILGSAEENMKLSQERAESVVNYLVENYGIDRSRLAAKGYGATRRISYNNTPEGRQKNRRINAVIDCVIK